MKTDKVDAKIKRIIPDQVPLTPLQAKRLAYVAEADAKQFQKLTVAQIKEKFLWDIDLDWLFFRKVCGQVVKTDPVTGDDHPVPFATVYVEDTDANFLGYFPVDSKYGWLYPVWSHREVIATVKTDACGRFCVWVPRFDIDYILQWRRKFRCYVDVFVKPSIRDILDKYRELIPHRPFPPEPDPGPLIKQLRRARGQVETLVGRATLDRISTANGIAGFGQSDEKLNALLDRPAFNAPVPPPVPAQLREMIDRGGNKAVAERLNVDAARIDRIDLDRYIGPLLRCETEWVAEFVPILDVPDITFRVAQDVDGDGDEETIYSENFFDVRWDAGAIPYVTLHASPIAVAAPTLADQCEIPDVPCATPAIVLAGLMPLAAPYLDGAGYATRPNRPHATGLIADPGPYAAATAPFTGTLQLYGCNQHKGATVYRVLYAFKGPSDPSFSSFVPFNNSWPLYRLAGGVLQKSTASPVDTAGWYNILSDADGWFPAKLLMNWPTGESGTYQIKMQLGNAARTVLLETGPITLKVDNTGPHVEFNSLAWRVAGTPTWHAVDINHCIIIDRPTGATLEFKVDYTGSARHLLKVQLSADGCGDGNLETKLAPNWSEPVSAINPYQHWHVNALDNNVTRQAIFTLPATAAEGAYEFDLYAATRAFNPSGGDGGFEADWFYNVVYRDAWAEVKFAVIDA
jgi:hypothetical protein